MQTFDVVMGIKTDDYIIYKSDYDENNKKLSFHIYFFGKKFPSIEQEKLHYQ